MSNFVIVSVPFDDREVARVVLDEKDEVEMFNQLLELGRERPDQQAEKVNIYTDSRNLSKMVEVVLTPKRKGKDSGWDKCCQGKHIALHDEFSEDGYKQIVCDESGEILSRQAISCRGREAVI